jgi:hypothetical protein
MTEEEYKKHLLEGETEEERLARLAVNDCECLTCLLIARGRAKLVMNPFLKDKK